MIELIRQEDNFCLEWIGINKADSKLIILNIDIIRAGGLIINDELDDLKVKIQVVDCEIMALPLRITSNPAVNLDICISPYSSFMVKFMKQACSKYYGESIKWSDVELQLITNDGEIYG